MILPNCPIQKHYYQITLNYLSIYTTAAIDALIAGFEVQFGENELDPNLWKAYFRAHAEFCTRCSVCDNAMEQEKLLQASRAPGESRLTRAEDISSDEEDDDPG